MSASFKEFFPYFLKLFPENYICTINKIVNQCINFFTTVLTHIWDFTIPNRECIITRKESIYNFVLKCLEICVNTYFKWQTKDGFPFMFTNIIYLSPFFNSCGLVFNFADQKSIYLSTFQVINTLFQTIQMNIKFLIVKRHGLIFNHFTPSIWYSWYNAIIFHLINNNTKRGLYLILMVMIGRLYRKTKHA